MIVIALALLGTGARASDDAKKAGELASRYKVEEKDIRDLRDKGMGWGEVDNALAIAERSGKPLSEIMKLRESGMGWGKIARQYGFSLGEVKRSDRADKAMRAERADPGHRADRGHKGGRQK